MEKNLSLHAPAISQSCTDDVPRQICSSIAALDVHFCVVLLFCAFQISGSKFLVGGVIVMAFIHGSVTVIPCRQNCISKEKHVATCRQNCIRKEKHVATCRQNCIRKEKHVATCRQTCIIKRKHVAACRDNPICQCQENNGP
jgi:hypothetical protein